MRITRYTHGAPFIFALLLICAIAANPAPGSGTDILGEFTETAKTTRGKQQLLVRVASDWNAVTTITQRLAKSGMQVAGLFVQSRLRYLGFYADSLLHFPGSTWGAKKVRELVHMGLTSGQPAGANCEKPPFINRQS